MQRLMHSPRASLLQVTGNNGVLNIAVDQPATDTKEGGEQEKEKDKEKDKDIVHRCITMASSQPMLLSSYLWCYWLYGHMCVNVSMDKGHFSRGIILQLCRKERSQNYKPRSIRLPPAADLEKAKAEYVDGVLIIIIPKNVRHQEFRCRSPVLPIVLVTTLLQCNSQITSSQQNNIQYFSPDMQDDWVFCRRRKLVSARWKCSDNLKQSMQERISNGCTT